MIIIARIMHISLDEKLPLRDTYYACNTYSPAKRLPDIDWAILNIAQVISRYYSGNIWQSLPVREIYIINTEQCLWTPTQKWYISVYNVVRVTIITKTILYICTWSNLVISILPCSMRYFTTPLFPLSTASCNGVLLF